MTDNSVIVPAEDTKIVLVGDCMYIFMLSISSALASQLELTVRYIDGVRSSSCKGGTNDGHLVVTISSFYWNDETARFAEIDTALANIWTSLTEKNVVVGPMPEPIVGNLRDMLPSMVS